MIEDAEPLGRGQGHVTYFLNFGTPSLTFERTKLLDTYYYFSNGTDTRIPKNVFLVIFNFRCDETDRRKHSPP